MARKLDTELKHLFGEEVLKKSVCIDYEQGLAEVEAMPAITEQLMELNGQPQAQRGFIKALSNRVAVGLCYWLRMV